MPTEEELLNQHREARVQTVGATRTHPWQLKAIAKTQAGWIKIQFTENATVPRGHRFGGAFPLWAVRRSEGISTGTYTHIDGFRLMSCNQPCDRTVLIGDDSFVKMFVPGTNVDSDGTELNLRNTPQAAASVARLFAAIEAYNAWASTQTLPGPTDLVEPLLTNDGYAYGGGIRCSVTPRSDGSANVDVRTNESCGLGRYFGNARDSVRNNGFGAYNAANGIRLASRAQCALLNQDGVDILIVNSEGGGNRIVVNTTSALARRIYDAVIEHNAWYQQSRTSRPYNFLSLDSDPTSSLRENVTTDGLRRLVDNDDHEQGDLVICTTCQTRVTEATYNAEREMCSTCIASLRLCASCECQVPESTINATVDYHNGSGTPTAVQVCNNCHGGLPRCAHTADATGLRCPIRGMHLATDDDGTAHYCPEHMPPSIDPNQPLGRGSRTLISTIRGAGGELGNMVSQHSIGVEVECTGGRTPTLPTGWTVGTDGSVTSPSCEAGSPPACGKALEEVLTEGMTAIRAAGWRVDSSCGMHTHVGNIPENAVWKVINTYAVFEPVIYAMLPRRRCVGQYSRPMSGKRITRLLTATEDVAEWFYRTKDKKSQRSNTRSKSHGDRYYGLNIHSYFYRGTMEFRHFPGTVDHEKALHWIRFVQSILKWAEESYDQAAIERTLTGFIEADDAAVDNMITTLGLREDVAAWVRARITGTNRGKLERPHDIQTTHEVM